MSNDNSSYRQIRQINEGMRENKMRTETASSTLESSTSHCLIFVKRSLRRRNPLTPFAFAHFFSTCSTPSNSLVVRQTMGNTAMECTDLRSEPRMVRRPSGRSLSLRLYFSQDLPTLTTTFAILASLCITILHSSLYCFTSWWHNCQHRSLPKGYTRSTCLSHSERLE
jgi:hypothetical protein